MGGIKADGRASTWVWRIAARGWEDGCSAGALKQKCKQLTATQQAWQQNLPQGTKSRSHAHLQRDSSPGRPGPTPRSRRALQPCLQSPGMQDEKKFRAVPHWQCPAGSGIIEEPLPACRTAT